MNNIQKFSFIVEKIVLNLLQLIEERIREI